MSERQPYVPNTWATGDLITATKMNNIEEGIAAIENDIYTGEGNLASQVKTMIEVKATQPSSAYNKLWAQPDNENGVLVPTEEELEDAVNMIAETFATNKAYAIGDYVVYDDGSGRKLYKFTAAHSAGAWNRGQVIEVKVESEVKGSKGDITSITNSLNTMSAATSTDVDKFIKVKTVAGGKVTEWKYEAGIPVDTTLAVQGAAADAKATGDAIAGAVAAIPAVDATLSTQGASADAKVAGDAIAATQAMNAAPYSASATYALGDYCTYGDKLYRCSTAIATAEAWTAAHWTEVKTTGEIADLKSAVNDRIDEIANDLYNTNIVASPYTTVENVGMKCEIESGGYVVTGTKNKAALYPFKEGTYTVNGLTIVVSGNTVTINGTASANTSFSLKDGAVKTNAELAAESYEFPAGNWYISSAVHSDYAVQQTILCRKKDNSGVITLNATQPQLFDSSTWGGFYIYVATGTIISRGTVFCISNDNSIGTYQAQISERVQWLKESGYFNAQTGDCIIANNYADIYTITLKTNRGKKAYLKYSTRSVSSSFAVAVIDVYITMPTGYVDYIFAHCQKDTVSTGGSDTWRLVQIDKVDGTFVRQYHITTLGETEMAIKIDGRDDFIGGVTHGDEWLNSGSAFAVLDGNMVDITDYTTLTQFEQFEFFATTTLYDPSDHATVIGEHGVKWTFTKDGLDLRQSVKFSGAYTLIGSHMPMICAVRDHYGVPNGMDYETYQITDTYADDGNFNHYDISEAGFETYPNTLKTDIHAAYMYGSEKDIRIEVEYIDQPTDLTGKGNWVYNGDDYNKLYNTICGGTGTQNVTSGTKWQVHSKIQVTANK